MPGAQKKTKKPARVVKTSVKKSTPRNPSTRKPAPKNRVKKTSRAVRRSEKNIKKFFKKIWKQLGIHFAILGVFIGAGLYFSRAKHPAPETKVSESELSHAQTPLDLAFEKSKAQSVGERISFWSEFAVKNHSLLDQATQSSPLVAQVADSAPLLKPHYDCTTFVETVSSLAQSHTASEWIPTLLKIRYARAPYSFENRNHFPELDWLPNNTAAKILSDLTPRVAIQSQVTLHREVKFIDRQAWLNAQIRHGQVTRQVASVALERWSDPGQMTQAEVSYIALNDFLKIAHQIPSGTLVNIVRKNDSRHPVLISHQGFLVRNARGKTEFHHASVGGTVQSVPWEIYHRRLLGMSKIWPVLGVNLAELQIP